MIPKTIHFIFGLNEDFGGRPFAMYHYMAVLSAKIVNEGYDIIMHYYYEPVNNEWWERTKQIAKMVKLVETPTIICGMDVKRHAHRADWVRLEILKSEGGIYLDIDTICINPFDSLLNVKEGLVMGLEMWQGKINGLCNAVIMAEKGHRFIIVWQAEFYDFEPRDYNKFAVRIPWRIAIQHPGWIHMEPPESFFRLNWNEEDLKLMFEKTISFERSYCSHLLHNNSQYWLSKLTLDDIWSKDTSYNLIAREILTKAQNQSIY
jgi:hypothetical protein